MASSGITVNIDFQTGLIIDILSVTSKKHYEPNQPADEPRPNPYHLLPGEHIFSEKQTKNI